MIYSSNLNNPKYHKTLNTHSHTEYTSLKTIPEDWIRFKPSRHLKDQQGLGGMGFPESNLPLSYVHKPTHITDGGGGINMEKVEANCRKWQDRDCLADGIRGKTSFQSLPARALTPNQCLIQWPEKRGTGACTPLWRSSVRSWTCWQQKQPTCLPIPAYSTEFGRSPFFTEMDQIVFPQ